MWCLQGGTLDTSIRRAVTTSAVGSHYRSFNGCVAASLDFGGLSSSPRGDIAGYCYSAWCFRRALPVTRGLEYQPV